MKKAYLVLVWGIYGKEISCMSQVVVSDKSSTAVNHLKNQFIYNYPYYSTNCTFTEIDLDLLSQQMHD